MTGACPQEDCGGPWGNPEFLEAIGDLDHDGNEPMLECPGFDPAAFDPGEFHGRFGLRRLVAL